MVIVTSLAAGAGAALLMALCADGLIEGLETAHKAGGIEVILKCGIVGGGSGGDLVAGLAAFVVEQAEMHTM
jgi:hypothetical protein